ncbi:trans-aconitate 2-methyltransferase, partial [Gemmatimonas sp.]|uniref:class I SAM-dependent methyltransferase n=1 Tax=Gemmatimonas sp. TaxID=1962908 RepID=UPI003561CED9
MVDHDEGWKLWTDMVRYYPAGVHRRRLVRSWTSGLDIETVLDVGCGPGHLLDEMRQALPDVQLTGVDNSAATVAENRIRQPWVRWETVDITQDSLNESFDLVICSEVLEHTRDDAASLANLVDMTGRYLMITVPSGPIRPLEAGFGHLRHYTLPGLEKMVRGAGLDIVRSSAWGFPFMSMFKVASNLRPDATMSGFGDGEWSAP